ncbi:MAG: hypothetical protein KatS3mg065_1065 [Chloroflexota bacterium]|nr:MAG: hypothetical protein KatS3mg065_1065 [Chloroflexota bacterium]
MLTGDLGRTALLARDNRLLAAELVLFHPIRFMLASPAEDPGEILRRLGPEVWLEDKYDGIRAQLHRAGERVVLFSRDLRPITEQFPEVAAAAGGLDWSGILDGELLAERDGRVLPFLALQSRLGRTAPPAALVERVPVTFRRLRPPRPRDPGTEPPSRSFGSPLPSDAGVSTRSTCRPPRRAGASGAPCGRSLEASRRSRQPSVRPASAATRGSWRRIREATTRRAEGGSAG